jgi:glycosyltransferase involved in cell wall biosynthesis
MRQVRARSSRRLRIAVIGPAPAIPGLPPQSGVAPYTIDLLTHLPDTVDIALLAQLTTEVTMAASHIDVIPCWRPGWRAASDQIRWLKHESIDLIHVQHEFSLFGGLLATARVIEEIKRYSHKRVPVVTTLHSVIPKDQISGEFLRRNGLPPLPRLGRAALHAAFSSIRSLTSKSIVHHDYFKQALIDNYGFSGDKIEVIPIGSKGHTSQSKDRSHRRLNILVFGFLTSYKLPELVVEAARTLSNEELTFTFSVAKNPRAMSRSYDARYEELERSVRAMGSTARWQGYILEEEIAPLFQDADILVLPYTECISVSAVAEIAREHGVAICHGAPLNPLFADSESSFELTAESLVRTLRRTLESLSRMQPSPMSTMPWGDAAQKILNMWQDAIPCESL